MTEDERYKLIDHRSEVWLARYGLPGYSAAESVDRNGDRQLWIVNRDALDTPNVDHGDEQPAHEQLGRLPVAVRDRVWGVVLRCGRPTASGRSCRARVTQPGAACSAHRAVSAS